MLLALRHLKMNDSLCLHRVYPTRKRFSVLLHISTSIHRVLVIRPLLYFLPPNALLSLLIISSEPQVFYDLQPFNFRQSEIFYIPALTYP